MKFIHLMIFAMAAFPYFIEGSNASGVHHSINIESNCDKVLNLLEGARERGYIGEHVSQLEHALECAHFAQISGGDDETVLAALFHDIGHLCAEPEKMTPWGVVDHDKEGAQFLRSCGLSEKVCQLVLGHVQAKRYLTYADPQYYAGLSEGSKATLRLQGGPMSQSEALDFEVDPLFQTKILMRQWDEQSKIVDLEVPDLDFYRPILFNHLSLQQDIQD